MFKYRLRPGYGSDKLLIEFHEEAWNEEFAQALKKVLKDANITATNKEDLVFFMIYNMTGEAGDFTLEVDEWNFVWVSAEDNQKAIAFFDEKLKASGMFEKEEVDFAQYKLKRTT